MEMFRASNTHGSSCNSSGRVCVFGVLRYLNSEPRSINKVNYLDMSYTISSKN